MIEIYVDQSKKKKVFLNHHEFVNDKESLFYVLGEPYYFDESKLYDSSFW